MQVSPPAYGTPMSVQHTRSGNNGIAVGNLIDFDTTCKTILRYCKKVIIRNFPYNMSCKMPLNTHVADVGPAPHNAAPAVAPSIPPRRLQPIENNTRANNTASVLEGFDDLAISRHGGSVLTTEDFC
jgi:hypothetical protein